MKLERKCKFRFFILIAILFLWLFNNSPVYHFNHLSYNICLGEEPKNDINFIENIDKEKSIDPNNKNQSKTVNYKEENNFSSTTQDNKEQENKVVLKDDKKTNLGSNPYSVTEDLTLLQGEESNGFSHHMIALNIAGVLPNLPSQDKIDAINGQDGLAILAHPNLKAGQLDYSETEILNISDYFGIEIYNGYSQQVANQGIATDKWDLALSNDHRVWGFGVDDSHNETQRGNGFTMVYSEDLTSEDIYQNLEDGDFYASSGAMIENISYSASLKRITVTTDKPSTIQYIGKNGHVYAEYTNIMGRSYYIGGDEEYIRVVIKNSDGYAWTQPFWIDGEVITNPYQSGFPNRKANLHCHGNEAELQSWYAEQGYSILAVTNYSHLKSYIGI
ncbi:hypothetical protein ACFLZS_00040 [Patescibacteria group bacterium]